MNNNLALGKKNYYFELILGIMCSNKSDELFKRYEHGKFRNLDLKLFRLESDNRFESEDYKGYITRSGKEYNVEDVCIVEKSLDSLITNIERVNPKLVLIEESQFFGQNSSTTKVADYIEFLVQDQKKIVIATGLLTDSEGNEFLNFGKIAAKADIIKYMPPPVCDFRLDDGSICENPATKSKCLIKKEEVVKEGNDIYRPRCRVHWKIDEKYVPKSKK